MERLGWGGGVGERGSGSLGPCVSKQGRARLTQTGVCLRSEVGGRRETHEGWDRAGRQPARSLAGRWEISPTFGISLKEGRLLRLLISLLAGLTLLLGPEAPGPGPQLQNSLVGSSGLCTFLGFRLPPPRGPPALLSPVPAQVSGARECLTLVDLISNPLTFSSARQAWVPGNVTILFPLPPTPAPTRPRIPSYPSLPLASPFPLLRWGKAGSCRRPWAPGTLHPEPLRRGSPARSLAFFTWLCKREGARRWGQCCPVRPPGVGPGMARGPAAASWGRGLPSRGRWALLGLWFLILLPPPPHRPPPSSKLESPKPRGSGRPGAGESPKASRA